MKSRVACFMLEPTPRWPAACACGYVFQDGDEWQDNRSRLYRTPSGVLEEC